MGKPPTGEPCAGEPHARFGGQGGATLPDPYQAPHVHPLVGYVLESFSESIFSLLVCAEIRLYTYPNQGVFMQIVSQAMVIELYS